MKPDPLRTNVELEQAVLGTILMNNGIVSSLPTSFQADHFSYAEHQAIYAAIRERIDAGQTATPVTLKNAFPGIQWPNGKTASQYMAELIVSCSMPGIIVQDYARDLQAMARLRSLDAIVRAGMTSQDFPDKALAEVLTQIDAVRLEQVDDNRLPVALGKLAEGVIDQINAQMNGTGTLGVPTGLRLLDNALAGGLKGGELIIVGARPGMGKTTFASSISIAAARQNFPVALFSLEMPRNQIGVRLISDWMFEWRRQAYNAMLMGAEADLMEDISLARAQMESAPLYVDDTAGLSVYEIAAKARKLSKTFEQRYQRPLALIVIDYLKFIKSTDRYKGNRNLEIGETTGALKRLSKDMNVPVVLLCQLNRQNENRDDKRPTLSDLRDSGEIEADADVVLFLYREAYYLKNERYIDDDPALIARYQAARNLMEIIIAKQRMGPTERVLVFADMAASALRNLGA